jgi:hypothetical protein
VCPDCGLTAQQIGEVHINAQRGAPGTPDVLAPLGVGVKVPCIICDGLGTINAKELARRIDALKGAP